MHRRTEGSLVTLWQATQPDYFARPCAGHSCHKIPLSWKLAKTLGLTLYYVCFRASEWNLYVKCRLFWKGQGGMRINFGARNR